MQPAPSPQLAGPGLADAGPRRSGRRTLTAVPLALLLSACGSSDPGSPAPLASEDGHGSAAAPSGGAPAPAGASPGSAAGTANGVVTYRVAQYTFPALTVAPGSRVRVVGGDDEPHTVTAENGSFDTGAFDRDRPGLFTAPAKPGTYRITCTVHPSMHGQIVVR